MDDIAHQAIYAQSLGAEVRVFKYVEEFPVSYGVYFLNVKELVGILIRIKLHPVKK